ncbi:hypothetical protein RHMOL_Rhmol05G0139100 [Rhododendron molle]|uniref:Uncharacterized protein n=1 Tax=Rhododendron molle TaxID=49168 RepID=A0ACC0NNQ3_RHOML|nr:hypothetical protein RHMOL_Rhmol05G0139100 [Rhododendron molle]
MGGSMNGSTGWSLFIHAFFINLSLPVLRRKSTSGTRNLPLFSWIGTRTSILNKWTPKMMWTRRTWNSTSMGKSSLMSVASLGLSTLW